jgi:phage terminase large subunit GpA-like protein
MSTPAHAFLPPPAVLRPDGRGLFLRAVAGALTPRPRLTVSQWADRNRILFSKASGEPGPWRTARTPFAREIMDCLSVNSTVSSTSFMKAAQIVGTEVLLNWIGYVMDHAPAPMLVVQPTLEARERFVKQRVDPMLVGTPAVARLFGAGRRRDATNTEAIKDFPGGMLILGGGNSPASLAQMPIKYAASDEIDRYPWEVGQEGDPHGLIRARQRNFRGRKELNISSPTVKGGSRIDELYEAGDQRQYHVPCPHCEQLQVLEWKNLRWTLDPVTKEPVHVAYVCRHCGAEIEEHHKTEMLKEAGHGGRARWIPKHPERSQRVRSYHINALYSPLGLGLRWIEMVRVWLEAQGDKTKLKVFINTLLGEAWEDQSRDLKPYELKARAEPYHLREIPPGCLRLTAGVDVHPDRFEVQVLGHGRGKIKWTVDKIILPADPARDEEWVKLENYLLRPFVNAFGRELRIEATAVDSGGQNTQDVYNWAREAKRKIPHLMVIKGANTPGKPVIAGRAQWQDINRRGRTIKKGVLLWMIGVDTVKHALFALLASDAQHEAAARKVRFSQELDDDYYKQLTAEVFDPEKNKFVHRRGRRNEALDTWVYAYAAAHHPELRIHTMIARDWDRLEQMLEPPPAPVAAGPPAPDVVPAVPPAPPPKPPASGGQGFGSEEWNL